MIWPVSIAVPASYPASLPESLPASLPASMPASLPASLPATAAAVPETAPVTAAPIHEIAEDLSTTADLLQRLLSSSAIGLFVAVAMLFVLVLSRKLIKDAARVRKLNSPTVLVLVYLGVASADLLIAGKGWLTFSAQLILVLSLISTGSFYFFDMLLPRWRGREVPGIVRDLVQAVLFLIIMIVLLAGTGIDISGVLVGSTVVTAVIGLALQDTLTNVIAGLSIQIEKPFDEGDWVTLSGALGELTGQVRAVTWRTTKLLTSYEDLVIIPNKTVANDSIINHSRPARRHRRKQVIGAPYAMPPNRVAQTLLDAARTVPGVLHAPAPDALLRKFGDFTVDYELRYFIDDFAERWAIDDAVMRRVWYYFGREGIAFPFPIRDVQMREITAADQAAERKLEVAARAQMLRTIDFLKPLSDADIARLAERIEGRRFAMDETIIRQGDEGDSMYLVRTGRVEVKVGSGPTQRTVATLGERSFFGEMSLMTGAPRAATVVASEDVEVYLLDKADFQDLMTGSPRLAEQISEALAMRQMGLQERAVAAEPSKIQEKSRDVLDKIRRFFRF